MKKIKSIFLFAASALAIAACKDPVGPDVIDPQAPVIESATLRGENGELKIRVGKAVKFSADISVLGSELNTYSIEVKDGDELLASTGGVIEGTSAMIEEILDLAINPVTLDRELTPTVIFKVTNVDDMFTEKTLAPADVVTICPPSLLPQMFLIDGNGKVYEMTETAQKGRYRTHGDISEISGSFTICENVKDGKADGESWNFDTPASEYGLRYIGYDAVTGEMFWMVDYTATFDLKKMAKDGAYDVYWATTLVPNCEVVFLNYGDKMRLQSDRFADVEENTARYTGQFGDKFEVYYMCDEKANWLTIKGQWSDNSIVWVTGEGASAPMEPYCEAHSLNWFEGNPACGYSALAMVNTEGSTYKVLMYMKDNFGIKIFDYWSWANELSWTSATPNTLVISKMEENPETGKVDGNYGNAGPGFTEGLWVLTYNKLTKEASLEKYVGRIADPVKGVEYTPDVPDPVDPDKDAALYLVDKAGHAWSMSVAAGTKYLTDEATSSVGSEFVFARKITETNAVDWSGKVYGMKDGAISEISEGGQYIPLDPAYAKYSKKPWMIYFDTASMELTYKEGIWISGMGDMGNGSSVIWVQTLPHNAEVWFFDGAKPVSEMVNLAVFDNIDDVKGCARYIGVSENYEVYYRKEEGWLILSNNICEKQKLLIGKNASFGQAPYTSYPIIETDIPRTAGQTLPLNRVSADTYAAYIYMAADASFQLYTDYAWGALNNSWESTTPGIVTRENFYAKLGADFKPGLYKITYNETDNKFTLEAK